MIKKMKDRQQLREKWQELYSSCSFDGLHYIFIERGILRCFWLLVVMGAIALSVFLFYGVLLQFFTYSEILSFEEVLSSDKVEFPTVTICNLNAVSRSKIERKPFNMSVEAIVDFYQDVRNGVFNITRDGLVLSQFRKEGVSNMEQIYRQYEYTMEEMLRDSHLNTIVKTPCMFKGQVCNEKSFIEIVSAKYGLCYQFNSIYLNKDTRLFANKTGEGSGLRLFLNIEEEDLLVTSVPFNGLQVFIHPYGEPFESAIAKRVPVSPGTMNFIHVSYLLVGFHISFPPFYLPRYLFF